MVDYSPFAYFIDWSCILNKGMLAFLDCFNSKFSRLDNGIYVYSAKFEKVKIKHFFQDFIQKCLDEMLMSIEADPKQHSIKKIYIVSSCKFNDNILNDNPEKINLTYSIFEHDIQMDILKLEDIFDRIFQKYFEKKIQLSENVRILHHSRLCSRHVESLLQDTFGKSHFIECSNFFKSDKLFLVDRNNALLSSFQSLNKIPSKKLKSIKFYEDELKSQF